MERKDKNLVNRHTFDYPIRLVVPSDQRESRGTHSRFSCSSPRFPGVRPLAARASAPNRRASVFLRLLPWIVIPTGVDASLFGRAMAGDPIKSREQKSRGEEKANGNTRPLEFRKPMKTNDQKISNRNKKHISVFDLRTATLFQPVFEIRVSPILVESAELTARPPGVPASRSNIKPLTSNICLWYTARALEVE